LISGLLLRRGRRRFQGRAKLGFRRKVTQQSSTIVGESMTDTPRFDHLARFRDRFGMADRLAPLVFAISSSDAPALQGSLR
jgi:hypothetical protein